MICSQCGKKMQPYSSVEGDGWFEVIFLCPECQEIATRMHTLGYDEEEEEEE